MKLLGNIITALICLTSFGFFFVSLIVVASHANWKEIAIKNKDQAETYLRDKRRAEEQISRNTTILSSTRLASATQIAYLSSEVSRLEELRSAASTSASQANATLQVTTKNLTETQNLLKQKDQENTKLRAQVTDTSQKLAVQAEKIAKLLSNLEQTQLQADRSKAQLQNVMAQYNALNQVALSKNFNEHTLKTEVPPNLNGRITSVSSAQKGVFSLSFGEDDGLRIGHVVDVTRNGRHIGTAKVIEAHPNNSTAKFLVGLQNERAQLNDKVTTELSKKFSLERNHVTTK